MTERLANNPLVEFAPDDGTGVPLAELKQHVLLFVESPPGPKTVRQVLELYFQTWGDPFVKYASTAFGSGSSEWADQARLRFITKELPRLRKHVDWGYSFSDGRKTDSWMLMFHGYPPFTESGKTSFYRFEFDWQVEAKRLKNFAIDLVDVVTCISGYVGFAFQGRPRSFACSSFNQVFAWARRYWGVEAQDLDVTVNHMAEAFKCVNWITIIGERLRQHNPGAVDLARSAAYAHESRSGGMLFQASDKPMLGDRNKREVLRGYVALAEALKELQVKNHGAFGEGSGSRWTEESTNAWLRRFTEPENVI